MTKLLDEPHWLDEVIEFLRSNLPFEMERGGWNDHASSAYQMGCEALIALGQADHVSWGAIPRDPPMRPEHTPRWDDLCVSVLRLAHHTNQIAYRRMDGTPPPQRTGGLTVTVAGAPPAAQPNVLAAGEMGPAVVMDDVLRLLTSLGLVGDGKWLPVAETIFWRNPPTSWAVDFTSDERFITAVEHASLTAPDFITEAIAQLAIVRDADIDEHLTRHETERAKLREKYGPSVREAPMPNPDQITKSILRGRTNEIDWMFFRGWRLANGWLQKNEAQLILPIFHDRLAVALRKRVAEKVAPGSLFGLSDQF